jgi:hypothetical protein
MHLFIACHGCGLKRAGLLIYQITNGMPITAAPELFRAILSRGI